jgi:ankyrin repeat protein
MQPGRFMVHALATTPYVDVVDSILRSRTSYSASESIGGSGVTALHLAAWRGPPEMVAFLARKFPEVLFLKDESGDTPFDIAVHYSRNKVSAILMECLLDQLNPYSGDYIWGKHVMESIAPYLGAETISSKPIGHLISLFSSIWWPRQFVSLYEQLRLPTNQVYLPLPKIPPTPSGLAELPPPLADGEKWYAPNEEPKETFESLLAMQREPKITHNMKRTIEKQIEHAAYDADADVDEEDDVRRPSSPQQGAAAAAARPFAPVSYPSEDEEDVQLREVDPEDLARGYWLELATNTGQEPASFAAQDLNDRCGKVRVVTLVGGLNCPYAIAFVLDRG